MSALLERRREATASALPVRALIVDDDPAYLGYAAALTRRIGFAVETAADGEAALARLAGGGFDVVVIDHEMPRLSGIETIGRIRAGDATRSIYAVMLTAHEDAETKLTALDAGFDDFLSKSAESEIVAKLVAARRVGARQRTLEGDVRLLEGLVSRDHLTGLFNRRFFSAEVESLIAAGTVVNVVLVDLDGFKEVNDVHGHLVGDAVLRDVAVALQAHTRPDDIVARLGGDEFVIAVPGVEQNAVEKITERLRAAIAALEWKNGVTFRISASAGFACSELLTAPTLDQLLEAADRDMYKEKWLRKHPETSSADARLLEANARGIQVARILVAEDDDLIRNLLRLIAQRCGEIVDAAPDGRAALALLELHRYDVVLLDLMMPEVNGYEIIQHVRTFPERPAVIVVTAMVGDRYLELDADIVTAVVHKPFDVDALADIVSYIAQQMADRRAADRAASPDDARLPLTSAPRRTVRRPDRAPEI
jgi:diguanylate cyclase (GGDEF)-like protein